MGWGYSVDIASSSGETPFTQTSISDSLTHTKGGSFARLDTGRHIEVVPGPHTPPGGLQPLLATSYEWPPGHHQPWGQIFVKDYDVHGNVICCENATFFFALTVMECYDCYFLNSFISQATFKLGSNTQGGPPCCSGSSLTGSGKDTYYLTLTFDNTMNNPYLLPFKSAYFRSYWHTYHNEAWIGWGQNTDPTDPSTYNPYAGIIGIQNGPTGSPIDGIDGLTPDWLPYSDLISSGIENPSPYTMRFTLNGIVTYTWQLGLLNASDVVSDFFGSASYNATGYGFIGLRCCYLSAASSTVPPVAIVETLYPVTACCFDDPWYGWKLIGGPPGVETFLDLVAADTSGLSVACWYGPGWNQAQDPWYDWFGGVIVPSLPIYIKGYPYWGSPINVPAELSFHTSFDQVYWPGWNWGTNPKEDTAVPTIDYVFHPFVYVPIWSK